MHQSGADGSVVAHEKTKQNQIYIQISPQILTPLDDDDGCPPQKSTLAQPGDGNVTFLATSLFLRLERNKLGEGKTSMTQDY